jgi:hypothetical protein
LGQGLLIAHGCGDGSGQFFRAAGIFKVYREKILGPLQKTGKEQGKKNRISN